MNIVAIDNSTHASLSHNTDSLKSDTSFCEKKLVIKIDANGFYDQGVRRWGVNCLRYLVKKNRFILGIISALFSCTVFSYDMSVDSINIKTHLDNFQSISCDSTALRCQAASLVTDSNGNDRNYIVRSTKDGGNTWSNPVVLRSILNSVDERDSISIHCNASGLACLIAVTTHNPDNPWLERPHVVFYTTNDAGENWSEPKLLPGVMTKIVSLSCNQYGDSCLLLGEYNSMDKPQIYMTQNAGFTWSGPVDLIKAKTSYELYNSVSSMSCSESGLDCTVVGGFDHPATYITKDGGYNWKGPYLLKDEANTLPGFVTEDFFSNIHCNSSGLTCIALRYQEITKDHGMMFSNVYSYTTFDAGMHWQKAGVLDNSYGEVHEPFHLFDCDKEGVVCVAIYSPDVEGSRPEAYTTYDGGQTWSKKFLDIPVESINTTLLDIFCNDSAALCHVVGM